ncbi:ankyrin repeat domain-containing protein [Candidatus Bathyarchaeota archaeon]|nr:ankyrin repeat domain-containing protein [Candidatus Bathyarchaeota archaeon]
MGPWNSLTDSGADVFWHDYLLYRCRNERDQSVVRFVEIRNVAKALLGHCKVQGVDHDYESMLGEVCRLALLEHNVPVYRGRRRGWDDLHESANRVPNLGLNLLSAATYFGYVDLVRDLLDQGYDPTEDDLFPVPMYLAAWTGQPAMLLLLRDHLPEAKDPNESRSEFEPWSLLGAAARGDMDMLRFALDPPSRTIPPSNDDDTNRMNAMLGKAEVPKHIQLGGKLSNYVRIKMATEPSGKAHQHPRNLVSESGIYAESNSHEAVQKAEASDIVIMRYLLDMEADEASKEVLGGTPLVYAVKSKGEGIAA